VSSTRIAINVSCGVLLLSSVHDSGAQNFPTKPIRMVTAEVGGSSDFIARLMALGLAPSLGQPIVVNNRGGSALIPIETVAKAPPDGYTLLMFTSNLWITPMLQAVDYDPVKDFAPITMASRASSILVVSPSLPVNSVRELVAYVKSKPGQVNYAHGPTGSASHVAGALFRIMAGVDMVDVTYKGAAQALVDVMSGQAQLMFPNAASVAPLLKTGKLKALAVTSAQPSVLFPALPTIAATGVPGYESVVINGLLAPARTPDAIIRRLSQDSVRFLQSADIKDKLLNGGTEPVGSTAQEFAGTMQAEIARLSKVIKSTGIKAE
jgi:tripartite-type tricarboxylate transporter receptor subunit TctC